MNTLSLILSGYGVQVPRLRREGGRRVVEVDIMVDLPMLMAVVLLLLLDEEDLGSAEEEVFVRVRSPRRCTSGMSTVRPARVMLGVPEMRARRETLLPESCEVVVVS
jgi:hypothetical protein